MTADVKTECEGWREVSVHSAWKSSEDQFSSQHLHESGRAHLSVTPALENTFSTPEHPLNIQVNKKLKTKTKQIKITFLKRDTSLLTITAVHTHNKPLCFLIHRILVAKYVFVIKKCLVPWGGMCVSRPSGLSSGTESKVPWASVTPGRVLICPP